MVAVGSMPENGTVNMNPNKGLNRTKEALLLVGVICLIAASAMLGAKMDGVVYPLMVAIVAFGGSGIAHEQSKNSTKKVIEMEPMEKVVD